MIISCNIWHFAVVHTSVYFVDCCLVSLFTFLIEESIYIMSLIFQLHMNYVYINLCSCFQPDCGLLGRNIWLKIM